MDSARWKGLANWLGWVGLILVGVLSLAPLLFESKPVRFVPPYQSLAAARGSKCIVILLMALAVGLRGLVDIRVDPRRGWTGLAALLLLATILTTCHWYLIDRDVNLRQWQVYQYRSILDGHLLSQAGAWSTIPHVFRPLPYGFTRTLECITGDWPFACTAYRWFFTYWFVWAFYRFVRLYHSPVRALLSVYVLLILYPLSIWYYWGQLTDPLSHALYALGLIYVVQNRWAELALALALGVLAKETVVILAPAYYLCFWRQGTRALARTAVLILCCTAAFLAARLPLGWRMSLDAINATSGLMIGSNFGFGSQVFSQGVAPGYQNYLQPLLFVGSFLPWVVAYWRCADARLKVLFLTQVPLVLVSSACFSWMYESRNFVPLLPILTSMALRGHKEPRNNGA